MAVLALLGGVRVASCADRMEALPGELKGVGVTEKLDALQHSVANIPAPSTTAPVSPPKSGR